MTHPVPAEFQASPQLTTVQDNPLHISIFPPHSNAPRAYLEFSFLLNASLDVFELRSRDRDRFDQDLGLLQIIDERLSIWGWETGTGTRFAIVVDARGGDGVEGAGRGVKSGGRLLADGDVRGVCATPSYHPCFPPSLMIWSFPVPGEDGKD